MADSFSLKALTSWKQRLFRIGEKAYDDLKIEYNRGQAELRNHKNELILSMNGDHFDRDSRGNDRVLWFVDEANMRADLARSTGQQETDANPQAYDDKFLEENGMRWD